MLLFLIKSYRTLRRALAARKHPSQFAWAIAFGLLLGLIPHGNLLAVATLLIILCLRINHPAMGLTAVGVTFVATKMDPFSHQVGDWVLSHDAMNQALTQAWAWPLVPWTDINNTVVVGSFVIGVALLLPTFMVTYPLLRMLVPRESDVDSAAGQKNESRRREADAWASDVCPPPPHHRLGQHAAAVRASADDRFANNSVSADDRRDAYPTVSNGSSTRIGATEIDFREISPPSSESSDATIPVARPIAETKTRIDVVRISPTPPPPHSTPRPGDKVTATVGMPNSTSPTSTAANDPAAMDEALNYLLHQLRDKTAGQTKGDAA